MVAPKRSVETFEDHDGRAFGEQAVVAFTVEGTTGTLRLVVAEGTHARRDDSVAGECSNGASVPPQIIAST